MLILLRILRLYNGVYNGLGWTGLILPFASPAWQSSLCGSPRFRSALAPHNDFPSAVAGLDGSSVHVAVFSCPVPLPIEADRIANEYPFLGAQREE